MTPIAEIVDRLRRLAVRRGNEGFYTDATLVYEAADALEALPALIPAQSQEPVAWQHRIFYEDTRKWSDWRPGRRDTTLANEFEERPLYAAPAPEGWRSMDSAPKDGTRVLVKAVTFGWSSDVCQNVATGDKWVEASWRAGMGGVELGWREWFGNERITSTDGALVALAWAPLPAAHLAPEGWREPDFIGRQPVLCVHGWTDPDNLCPECEHPAAPLPEEA